MIHGTHVVTLPVKNYVFDQLLKWLPRVTEDYRGKPFVLKVAIAMSYTNVAEVLNPDLPSCGKMIISREWPDFMQENYVHLNFYTGEFQYSEDDQVLELNVWTYSVTKNLM